VDEEYRRVSGVRVTCRIFIADSFASGIPGANFRAVLFDVMISL
jgi:hypothetical protein